MERPLNTQIWDIGKPLYMAPIYDKGIPGKMERACATKDEKKIEQTLNNEALYVFRLLAGFEAPPDAWAYANDRLTAIGKDAGITAKEIAHILYRAKRDGKENPHFKKNVERDNDGMVIRPPRPPSRCQQWMTHMLTEQPGILRTDLIHEGRLRGFEERTLERALAKIGTTVPVKGAQRNAKQCYLKGGKPYVTSLIPAVPTVVLPDPTVANVGVPDPVPTVDTSVPTTDKILDSSVPTVPTVVLIQDLIPVSELTLFADGSQANLKGDGTEDVGTDDPDPWDGWDGHSPTWSTP